LLPSFGALLGRDAFPVEGKKGTDLVGEGSTSERNRGMDGQDEQFRWPRRLRVVGLRRGFWTMRKSHPDFYLVQDQP
jgi:hypothetical protein